MRRITTVQRDIVAQTISIRRADLSNLSEALPALLGILQTQGVALPDKDLKRFLEIARTLQSDATGLDVIVRLKRNRTARLRMVVR